MWLCGVAGRSGRGEKRYDHAVIGEDRVFEAYVWRSENAAFPRHDSSYFLPFFAVSHG
jgi:hypothetical protein